MTHTRMYILKPVIHAQLQILKYTYIAAYLLAWIKKIDENTRERVVGGGWEGEKEVKLCI